MLTQTEMVYSHITEELVMSDAEIIKALCGCRGPEWHPCLLQLTRPVATLESPTLLWVPKKARIALDDVATCIANTLHIPKTAQTLTYVNTNVSRQYGAHRSECKCQCHHLKRTNLASDDISVFMLTVDTAKMVNKGADAFFKRWASSTSS